MKDARFRSTVEHYLRHRPRYPGRLIRAVARLVGLGSADRVLDLGTGPGFLAIAFAPLAGEVLAMDPEPAMLETAEREAERAGVRLTLLCGGSTDLGPALGRLKLVTMGRSFHWMDRPATLAALDRLVVPDGAIAIFREARPPEGKPAWREAWDEVRELWTERLGGDPAWRSARALEPHPAVLARSAFGAMVRLAVDERRRTSMDDLIGRSLSMSNTSPARLGERRPAFEADLRAALAPFASEGAIEEHLAFEALVAWRPEVR